MTDHLQTARGQACDIVPGEGPLEIASDADLAARGFDRDVTFNGGALQATGDRGGPERRDVVVIAR